MSSEYQAASLLDLFEQVSNKNQQLQRAIHSGDDALVAALDREIDPLITEMINHRASEPEQIYLQLSLLTRLLREDADDRSCVLRHASMLSVLIERYFGPRKPQPALDMGSSAVDCLAELGDDEQLNESILNNLPDRVAVVTRDDRYLFANPAMAALLKVRQMDLIGRSIFDCNLSSAAVVDMRMALDAAFAGRSGEFASAFHDGYGDEVVFKGRYAPLKARQGLINGAVLTLTDSISVAEGVAA
ncbi:PAS domain-containing protein [Rhizobium sp. AAP43]|uniref:PAS domain-containing protein n=1 Tax=Rhizobium sp. AAP43 TaxID=1523420 RepID=UPI0006B9A645|nr:PAS domain-containing protein [Rhizobium sp. AAP43]KPF44122.1 diguanylate cyclase [Rhizobium sp. AAP43]